MTVVRAALVAVALSSLIGCGGDVCAEAAQIIADCQGGEPSAEGECTGPIQSLAECVVEKASAYCQHLRDRVNSPNPC